MMYKDLLILHDVIEVFCLLFAVIFLRKTRDWWNSFIYYMACVVLVELTGGYIIKTGNNWLYNLFYLPVYFGWSLFILYRICAPLFPLKVPVSVIAAAIAGSYLLESSQSGFREVSARTFILANLCFIILCFDYFYYLLKDEAFVDIKRHPPFWIITGLLFFCFGSTANYIFYDILKEVYLKYDILLRQYLMIVVNFLLYGCWSYAFLCKYREKK